MTTDGVLLVNGESAITLNQQMASCLKEQTNVGVTLYHNVCTGSMHAVPWGTIEYLFWVALVLLASLMGAVAARAVFGR